ncbi:MAG: ABC transporter substrate-binding protein, partial [Tissierellia bacterium]|nr:ABC transporter substrate-binding protein [Tissierellia bacterium]
MKLKFIIGLLLIVLVVAGCSTAAQKADLVIAVPQDPDFLDPHKAEAAGTQEMMNNVFEGLMKASVEGMPVE